jgi:hypothetical protein
MAGHKRTQNQSRIRKNERSNSKDVREIKAMAVIIAMEAAKESTATLSNSILT